MSEEQAQTVEQSLKNQVLTITDVQEKRHKEWSPLPYDLTELQQVANPAFWLLAKKH